MNYRCELLQSIQGLPVGARITINDKKVLDRRIANGEVKLLSTSEPEEIDESIYEEDAIHSDNAHEFERAEENHEGIEKRKGK